MSERTLGEKRCACEFETLVIDGPHMERPIEFDSEIEWGGTQGRLRITDAWLSG